MFDLSGRVALVAGGTGWLGLPVCKALAQSGAAVVVASSKQEHVSAAEEELRREVPQAKIKGLRLDIANEDSIKSAVEFAVSEFGGLGIVVNMTSQYVGKLVEEIAQEEFNSAMNANLFGSLALARESARVMKPGGSIIFFSSMYGHVSPDLRIYAAPMKPNPIEYGMAKAAIGQMVKYLAVYWASKGIRVNAISPGPFPKDKVQETDPAFIERLSGKVPMGRIGKRDECAGTVVYLASDASSYVTGQAILVDGGWTAW